VKNLIVVTFVASLTRDQDDSRFTNELILARSLLNVKYAEHVLRKMEILKLICVFIPVKSHLDVSLKVVERALQHKVI